MLLEVYSRAQKGVESLTDIQINVSHVLILNAQCSPSFVLVSIYQRECKIDESVVLLVYCLFFELFRSYMEFTLCSVFTLNKIERDVVWKLWGGREYFLSHPTSPHIFLSPVFMYICYKCDFSTFPYTTEKDSPTFKMALRLKHNGHTIEITINNI